MGLGTGVDFSLLASACRGHFVGVCLHGVSVDTVALAVVVVVRRLFIFYAIPQGYCANTHVMQTHIREVTRHADASREMPVWA